MNELPTVLPTVLAPNGFTTMGVLEPAPESESESDSAGPRTNVTSESDSVKGSSIWLPRVCFEPKMATEDG